MLPDRAILCTARALIALCCDDERVIGRANAYLRDGNIEKYIEWMRVLSALSDLVGLPTKARMARLSPPKRRRGWPRKLREKSPAKLNRPSG